MNHHQQAGIIALTFLLLGVIAGAAIIWLRGGDEKTYDTQPLPTLPDYEPEMTATQPFGEDTEAAIVEALALPNDPARRCGCLQCRPYGPRGLGSL